MYLLDGFQSLVMNKIISKIFVTDFSDFLMKFWEISKNALILSIFELEKCSFFLNRSEFRQKKIGAVIRDPMTAKCDIWRQFWSTFMFLLIWSHGGSVCSVKPLFLTWGTSYWGGVALPPVSAILQHLGQPSDQNIQDYQLYHEDV